MLVRLGGVVAVIRIIGAVSYGRYVAAAAFVSVIAALAQMGAETYLVRQVAEPEDRLYREVLGFLVVTSLAGVLVSTAVSLLAAPLIGHPQELRLFRVLVWSVPVNVAWAPAQARIERAFGFARLGALEIGGDGVLYVMAVSLALAGAGPWSLVGGFIAWQAFLLVGSAAVSGMFPRLAWSNTTARSLLRHGVGYSASEWLDRLAGLVNPVVVGSYVGAAGVAYVALAARLVDTFGFAQRAIWRLGLVTLSRLRDAGEQLGQAIEEATALYAAASGAPLAALAVVSGWLVPAVFGPAFGAAVVPFSLFAISRLVSSGSMLQTTLLVSRGRNLTVAASTGIRAVVLLGVALVAVPVMGVDGFGVAGLCTAVAAVYVHHEARRIAPLHYRRALPWLVCLGPPMLFPLASGPARAVVFLPAVAMVAWPATRHELGRQISMVTMAVRGAGRS